MISKWPKPDQKDLPFLFSTVRIENDWNFPEHSHLDFFELVYVHNGHFRHKVNNTVLDHAERMLLLVRHDDEHELAGKGFTYTNMMVPVRWIRQIEKLWNCTELSNGIFASKHPIYTALTQKQHVQFENELINLNTPPTREGRTAKFSGFLINIFLNYFANPSLFGYEKENLPEWLNNTISWIHKRREQPIRVADIVEHCNKCPEHVARAFKTYLNMTPSQYLNQQRLEYAADLLSSTNYPLLEICYSVGFDNPSYFHRLFKKNFGLTPAAYRKANYNVDYL